LACLSSEWRGSLEQWPARQGCLVPVWPESGCPNGSLNGFQMGPSGLRGVLE
jgi:hypothetical protein